MSIWYHTRQHVSNHQHTTRHMMWKKTPKVAIPATCWPCWADTLGWHKEMSSKLTFWTHKKCQHFKLRQPWPIRCSRLVSSVDQTRQRLTILAWYYCFFYAMGKSKGNFRHFGWLLLHKRWWLQRDWLLQNSSNAIPIGRCVQSWINYRRSEVPISKARQKQPKTGDWRIGNSYCRIERTRLLEWHYCRWLFLWSILLQLSLFVQRHIRNSTMSLITLVISFLSLKYAFGIISLFFTLVRCSNILSMLFWT